MPSRHRVFLLAAALASLTALTACGSKQTSTCGLACCEPGSACPVTPSYLFATNINGQLSAFPVQPAGGLGTPVNVAGPSNVTLGLVTLNPQYVYASNPDPSTGSSVEGWSFNNANGSLTPVPGSPFALPTLSAPRGMATGGGFLYIADTGSIDAFHIDTNTGSLTAANDSPFPSGSGDYLAWDPQNTCLYASDDNPPGGVMAFTTNPATGALTLVPGSPFLANPASSTNTVPMQIAVDSIANFIYVSLEGTSQVAGFSSAADCSLTPVPGSPFSAGKGNVSLTTINNLLYVSNAIDQTVSGFSIDSTTGVLTPLSGSPFAIRSTVILASPFSSFLYSSGPGGISAYSIENSTGTPTPISGSPFPSDSPTALAYSYALLP
jgi:6-phosphogluconolactonase